MFRLIFKNLTHRRWATFGAWVGIALGAAALFGVFLLQRGLAQSVERGRRQLGADLLVVPADVAVDAEKVLFAGSPIHAYMPRSLVEKVRRTEGVLRVESQFFTQTLRLACCSGGTETRLVGVEEGALRRLGPQSAHSRTTLAVDEVVLGAAVFPHIEKPGAQVEILGKIFRVAWRLDATGASLDQSILLAIDSARALAAQSDALRPVWEAAGAQPEQLVSALVIEVANPQAAEAVARRIEALGKVNAIRAGETFLRTKRLLDAFALVLTAAAILTALGGAAALFGHCATAAWERRTEWALYRALGASRGRVGALVAGEAVALAAAGVLAGIPAGWALSRAALAGLTARNAIPNISPETAWVFAAAAATLALYLATGVAAALFPALHVARLAPAEVLKEG
jgi:putative ABC transport system permease protein